MTGEVNTTTSSLGRFMVGFTPLFYLKTPSGSSFKDLSEVPNYLEQVTIHFLILIAVEAVIRWLQRKPLPRINDSISSISNGIISELAKLVIGAIEVASFVWIHHNFCLIKLPWNSAITWWIAFFGVDFAYYWFHRMAHEVNIFWMAHQVHHSSEDYTLSTALRQSLMQRYTSWIFNLPLALVVPPSAYAVHKQLNLLYQFWIHTEVISHLGPLEWILNTPSHHRVHHGRNPYCIDKNYAGMLIIWDRLFGTFAPESDKVVYGLVHPLNSWNPLWAQFHHSHYIITSIGSQKGFLNKIYFLFKGPGWSPGKPRLGSIEDIPQVSPDEKPYNTTMPHWLNVYCIVHFLLVLYYVQELTPIKSSLSYFTVLAFVLYFIFALTNFGLMLECRYEVTMLEILRLLIAISADSWLAQTGVVWSVIRGIHWFSLTLWVIVLVKTSSSFIMSKTKTH